MTPIHRVPVFLSSDSVRRAVMTVGGLHESAEAKALCFDVLAQIEQLADDEGWLPEQEQ